MKNVEKQTVAEGHICRTTAVIPNYNGIKYIENCLDSLFAGSVVPKVVIVDNGSTDGSRQFIEKKYLSRPEVTLISLNTNTGFCHAVNVGIAKADTEFVFLLNNDTETDERCVEMLQKVLDGRNDIFSASAKMLNLFFPEKIDDAGDFYSALGWAYARGKDQPVTKYNKEDRIFASCGGAVLYRRALFEQVGVFDEAHFAYLEDIDIGYRANIMGLRNVFAPKALVYHAGSGVSGSRYNDFKVNLSSRNSIYLIYKNMPLLQILFNLPFLLAGCLIKLLFFSLKGMGKTYFRGILRGFKLVFSETGRKNKVCFKWRYFPNYLWVQWELWFGMVRRFF